jgi:hypothetical protein
VTRGHATRTAVLVGVFAAGPAAPAGAALTVESRIGPWGVGPVIIGTTPAQAAATGTRFTATLPAPGSSCRYLTVAPSLGLRFLVENGTLRRAEVSDERLATTTGIRVGDAVTRIAANYAGRITESPDKYDAAVRTLTIGPSGAADAKYRLVFKVRNGRIQSIMAGALPQVEYVEGCS